MILPSMEEHQSLGWFFDSKLHTVINYKGELIAFKITSAKVNDAKASQSMRQLLQGLAFGDKGYLGKQLFSQLLAKGLKVITRVRINMNKVQYTDIEKQLLNQRGIIGTVINHLKHHYHVWHFSVVNAVTHLM
jgi:hypothetical protein